MKEYKRNKGITLIALVVTIQVNCSYLAMERKNKKDEDLVKSYEKLKKELTSYII